MTSWQESWATLLGIEAFQPTWLLAMASQLALFIFYIVPCSLLIHILDRKIGADFQARIGPSRVGLNGFMQPIADVLKLFGKQTAPESASDRFFFSIVVVVLYSTAAVFPVSRSLVFLDNDLGIFVPFGAIVAIAFLGLYYGLVSREINHWFDGLRQVFRLSSGLFPALIAVLGAAVTSGGYRWEMFSPPSASFFGQWLVFRSPFQCVSLVVFIVSGFIILGVSQFQVPPTLVDTTFGINRRAQGRSIVVLEFIRYYGFLLWSALAVGIFLGGASLPAFVSRIFDENGFARAKLFAEILSTTVKTFGVMLTSIWISRVNPRSRVDHLSELGWKVLSPIAVLALFGEILWEGGMHLYAQF